MGFPFFGQPFGSRFARAFGRGGGQSIASLYQLLDQFNTPRSAGSVNGTQAEPTGQVRTVTDTGNHLTISGDRLIQSGNHVAAGDPGLWYPSVARVVGQVLGFQITPVTTSAFIAVGFDTNQAGFLVAGFYFQSAGDLRIVDGSGGQISVVGTYTATSYFVKIIPRAIGYWLFIKGGAFTNQTLYFICPNGANAALFPSIGAGAAGANGGSSFDYDSLSIAIYIPSPLAYDTFTRANGALGSTETIGPDGQVLAALAWVLTAGIWAIVTNKAVGTPATLGSDVIVNGNFSAGTNWTLGSGWAIGAGTLNGTATTADASQTVAPMTAGRWYQIVYTVSAFIAGSVAIVSGSSFTVTRAANGTYTETLRETGTNFLIRGVTAFTGSIDNVSAKLLTTAELFASITIATADVIADVAVTLPSATGGVQAGLVLNLDSTSNPQNFILAYLKGDGNLVLDECVAGVYTQKIITAVTYSAGAVLRVIRSGTECRVFYNNAAVGTLQTMTANVNTKHGLFSTSPLNSLDGFTLWARGTGGEYAGLDAF